MRQRAEAEQADSAQRRAVAVLEAQADGTPRAAEAKTAPLRSRAPSKRDKTIAPTRARTHAHAHAAAARAQARSWKLVARHSLAAEARVWAERVKAEMRRRLQVDASLL